MYSLNFSFKLYFDFFETSAELWKGLEETKV